MIDKDSKIESSSSDGNWDKEKEELQRIIQEQKQLIDHQKKEIEILEERIELLANVDDGTKILMEEPTKLFKVRQNTKRVFGKGELVFRRKIFAEWGMRETTGDNWALLLDISPIYDEKIKPWQKRDCMPGSVHLCRKDLLHNRLTYRENKFGSNIYNFWSKSFLLPDEFDKFKDYFSKLEKPIPFILKAASSSCGRNIKLINSLEQVDPNDTWIKEKRPVCQKYLSDVLLIDGFKFTFRIYVVVTEVDPIRFYIYPEGLARIASKKYSLEESSFSNLYIHLDSIDINEVNTDEFTSQVSKNIEHEGLRCTVKYVLKHFAEREGMDSVKAWSEIEEVVRKTIFAGEPFLTTETNKKLKFRKTAFHLFGFDILLDKEFKPWVLEVNHVPSMSPHTDLENKIKTEMLRDMYTLVDVLNKDKNEIYTKTDELWKIILEKSEKTKVDPSLRNSIKRFDLDNILHLNKPDIWSLVDYEFERKRVGNWKMLFPFPDNSYDNLVLKNRNILHVSFLKKGWDLKKLEEIINNI